MKSGGIRRSESSESGTHPDISVIVHFLLGFESRNFLLARQHEVGPKRTSEKFNVIESEGIIFQDVDARSSCLLLCFLNFPRDGFTVEFVISEHKQNNFSVEKALHPNDGSPLHIDIAGQDDNLGIVARGLKSFKVVMYIAQYVDFHVTSHHGVRPALTLL